ncbi:MAG: gliding motility-associated C-terminal domain-containing protein [Sphingobacteriaceae bacterium]|nr:gliding motility-associated C-terminal domain-containing protein [Sphingobacteriaceae bacterium]
MPNDTGFPCKSTCYTVKASNEFGCTITDQICIEITKEHLIYIPNSFTPNNDGLNDEFKVYGDGISIVKMTIYDRWGKNYILRKATMRCGMVNTKMKCAKKVFIFTDFYTEPFRDKRSTKPAVLLY